MQILYEKQKMPEIFTRNGLKCYLDPIREKLIYITPEETVRQQVISYLLCEMRIPKSLLRVEQHLSEYGIKSARRADIVIHRTTKDGKMLPLAVIECKANDIPIDEKAVNQALDYCDDIGADYAMLTNGNNEVFYKYDSESNKYEEIRTLPYLEDMLNGEKLLVEKESIPERIAFDKLENFIAERNADAGGENVFPDISVFTPIDKAAVALNCLESFLDCNYKINAGKYGIFDVIEDYGVRLLKYGNASGGMYYGPYRSFLVRYNGSTEFVSLSVVAYNMTNEPLKTNTCLAVAIDNEEKSHHALQLSYEKSFVKRDSKYSVIHDGRISIGKIGSGKKQDLIDFVSRKSPELIENDSICLGELTNNRLWNIDDEEMQSFVINLIKYALIRDDFRKTIQGK